MSKHERPPYMIEWKNATVMMPVGPGDPVRYTCRDGKVLDLAGDGLAAIVFVFKTVQLATSGMAPEMLRSIIYGPTNPLLTPDLAGNAVVTSDVLDRPSWKALMDILSRSDGSDVADVCTMPLGEAAVLLGVPPDELLAEVGGKVVGRVVGGKMMLHEGSVRAFGVWSSNRPRAANGLRISYGVRSGEILRAKYPGDLKGFTRSGSVSTGYTGPWKEIGVLVEDARGPCFYVLHLDTTARRLASGALFVEGKFKVVSTVRGGDARRGYASFAPS